MNIRGPICAVLLLAITGCRSEVCKPSERYLVVTPTAGMANRLRVIASAVIMAAQTNRKLVVNWPIVSGEMPGLWSDFFLNPLPSFEKSDLALKDGCTLRSIQNAAENDKDIRNLASVKADSVQKEYAKIPYDPKPLIYLETFISFMPDLPHDEYWERYRHFYKNLKPVSSISNAVNKFKKDHNFEDKFMVGVHYRSWGMGESDRVYGVKHDQEYQYMTSFIDEMKKSLAEPLIKTNNKSIAFFIATDDAHIKSNMLAVPEFTGRIFSSSLPIERNTIEGQRNALIDWFLLASTNYIIGTNQSSFSEEASKITTERKKINIGNPVY